MSIEIKPEGEPLSYNSTNYTNCIKASDTGWQTSSSSNTQWEVNPPSISSTASTTNPQGATDSCNESLVHSNSEKAVFHSVKGAKRLLDEGQHDGALRIAGAAGKAFLEAEGLEYDAERSEDYLLDRIIKKVRSDEKNIREGIEKAWSKIDGGNHKGGARIAISIADQYLENYETP